MKSFGNFSSLLCLLLSALAIPIVLASSRERQVKPEAYGKSLSSSPWAQSRVLSHRREASRTIPAAVVVPPVLQNLARGSILKCLADLTGGLVSSERNRVRWVCFVLSRQKSCQHAYLYAFFSHLIAFTFSPRLVASHSKYGSPP